MTCNVEDLLSKEDQDCNNQHDQQLMTCKHNNGRGHNNQSNPQSTASVDCKLNTDKHASISSKTMKNEDTINIMDELAAMRPLNQLRSLIPEYTLHRISKMVMKEAIEDKKVELM